MRSRAALVSSALLLGVSLTVVGCGADGVRTASDAPAGKDVLVTEDTGRPDNGAGARRAAEVVKAWTGSAAERAWRKGYRPLDQAEWLPPDAFRSEGDKVAFISGHLDLVTQLPASGSGGPEATVTWQDGSTVRRPLLTSRHIFDGLARNKSGCDGTDCNRRLRVTGVKAATRTLATSRGPASIPVWEFTIEGYAQPFAYPAVAPDQPPRGPQSDRPAPDIDGVSSAGDWNGLSSDGLVLNAGVSHGSCVNTLPGQVYETKDAVVLIGRVEQLPKGTICDADLRVTPVRFRLSRPLGTRTVLDAVTGDPMALMTPGGAAR
ncbi:hypothetical protein [Streptomyces sp. RKAG337]|uniref:hypothetical protein n=1 Tax=Streptomyces sp. RKAG337 TaxID=2893404 RepID=UPI0020339586|nr:hypothetical protein [Streptomyces sp. RKAG337]MCM2430106.1 hypothetical protein [Streptomyces sp. RKAG337]